MRKRSDLSCVNKSLVCTTQSYDWMVIVNYEFFSEIYDIFSKQPTEQKRFLRTWSETAIYDIRSSSIL